MKAMMTSYKKKPSIQKKRKKKVKGTLKVNTKMKIQEKKTSYKTNATL